MRSLEHLVGAQRSERPAQLVEAGGGGGFLNVKSAPFHAVGDGLSNDRSAIVAAIAVASAAGGGVVFFPPGSYLITAALVVPSNVVLQGSGRSSVIKIGGAGSFNAVDMQGSEPQATTISGTPARGDLTFTLTSATGFATGDYFLVFNTENAAPNNSYFFISQITNLAGAVVTSAVPLPFAIGASDTETVAKVSLVTGSGVRDLTFDATSNSGATTRCIFAQYLRDCVFENLTFINCESNAAAWIGKALNCTVDDLTAYGCGTGSESDITFQGLTQCAVSKIKSFRATGFGPQLMWGAYNDYSSIISQDANDRGIKLAGCLFSNFDGLVANNSGQTGVSITLGSQYNNLQSLVAVSQRGTVTQRQGIWFSDQNNSNNVIDGFTCFGNTDAELTIQTTDTGNMVCNGRVGDETLIFNTGGALLLGINGAAIFQKDDGAGVGPILELRRRSASPAGSDNIGMVRWNGVDSAGNLQTYGDIYVQIVDPTSGSEDSWMKLVVFVGGASVEEVGVANGVIIGTPTGGFQGSGTLNLDNGLYRDGIQVVSAQGALIADASGGATIDTQARTAINTLLARLRVHGLIAT